MTKQNKLCPHSYSTWKNVYRSFGKRKNG